MDYETILTARDDDVLTLTLDRPERLNAASPLMFDEISAVLDNPGDARALLITGAGRAFCSGADLAGGDRAEPRGDATYHALSNNLHPVIYKLSRLNIPVVCAVNGPAAGIGCSLALAADFVLMGSSAYLLQAFVNIGLVPDGGASWMLARLVGKARATEMMLLGERIHGPKAAEWGLVYKCVDDAALMDEANALAARLAGGPTLAIGLMRQGLAAALDGDLSAALNREAENQRIAANSADAVEGAMSFIAKRKPIFQGK